MRAWFFGLMTLVPIGVLGASCALGSFENIEAPVDAGIDLGCQHTSVPLPPNLLGTDAGLDDADAEMSDVVLPEVNLEFTSAVRILRLKYSADGGPLGLDLDRYCSCQGETPSCIAPDLQDPELACDLPAGRDNQVKGVFGLMESLLQFDAEKDSLGDLYSDFAELGRWSVLLRVTNYNGLANDSKVRVEWYPSAGRPPPAWDGNDLWPIVPSAISDAGVSQDGGPLAVFSDDDAYVTDNVLVFALQESEMTASTGINKLSIIISDGTGMARIVPEPNGYVLRDGLLAGRIRLENVFKMVADFRDHNGAPFCADGNPYWGATRDTFCRGLDIQVGSPQPNKKCDAMSVSIGFDTAKAVTGLIELPDATDEQINCPNGTDPYSTFLDSGCAPP